MRLRLCISSATVAIAMSMSIVPFAQSPPQFRAQANLVRFDVTVLDRDRNTVQGLTRAAFTVVEDSKPQKITAFEEIDVPGPPAAAAPWELNAGLDVNTNANESLRLVVIIMDDAVNAFDPGVASRMKEAGRAVIAELGPNDLAAIVFTADNRRPEDFTTDRGRLLAALERRSIGWDGASHPLFRRYTVSTVAATAEFLKDAPEKRKALIYVSQGIASLGTATPMPAAAVESQDVALKNEIDALLESAKRANVSVFSVDPSWAFEVGGAVRETSAEQTAYLRGISFITGGFLLNKGDLTEGVKRIFRETSSYYMIGYTPTNTKRDGAFRRVDVRVAVPGAMVVTRKGYEAPADKRTTAKPSAAQALSGIIPATDVPLEVSIAPFADPGYGTPDGSTLAIVVSLPQPEGARRMTRSVDLHFALFDPEGRPLGSDRHTARFAMRPSVGAPGPVEVLARLAVEKPGQYSVRVGAYEAGSGAMGSVHTMVDVPEFSRADLSLSGLVLTSSPAREQTPRNVLADLLPAPPTAARTFSRRDRAMIFARVYQSQSEKAKTQPVTVRVSVVDDQNAGVLTHTDTIAADVFAKRFANYTFSIPTETLRAAAYLLTLEAQVPGKPPVTRQLRFRIQ